MYVYITPTEKVSKCLFHILKPIMPKSWFYVKDSGDFLKTIKNIGKIPEVASWLQQMLLGAIPTYLMGQV